MNSIIVQHRSETNRPGYCVSVDGGFESLTRITGRTTLLLHFVVTQILTESKWQQWVPSELGRVLTPQSYVLNVQPVWGGTVCFISAGEIIETVEKKLFVCSGCEDRDRGLRLQGVTFLWCFWLKSDEGHFTMRRLTEQHCGDVSSLQTGTSYIWAEKMFLLTIWILLEKSPESPSIAINTVIMCKGNQKAVRALCSVCSCFSDALLLCVICV